MFCVDRFALFKDLIQNNIGYQKLIKEINIPFHINHKSIQHNTKIVRTLGEEWSQQKIVLGNIQEWKRITKKVHQNKNLPKINLGVILLLIFQSKNIEDGFKKDENWSYKLNKPGRRYMMIRGAP